MKCCNIHTSFANYSWKLIYPANVLSHIVFIRYCRRSCLIVVSFYFFHFLFARFVCTSECIFIFISFYFLLFIEARGIYTTANVTGNLIFETLRNDIRQALYIDQTIGQQQTAHTHRRLKRWNAWGHIYTHTNVPFLLVSLSYGIVYDFNTGT